MIASPDDVLSDSDRRRRSDRVIGGACPPRRVVAGGGQQRSTEAGNGEQTGRDGERTVASFPRCSVPAQRDRGRDLCALTWYLGVMSTQRPDA